MFLWFPRPLTTLKRQRHRIMSPMNKKSTLKLRSENVELEKRELGLHVRYVRHRSIAWTLPRRRAMIDPMRHIATETGL